MRKQAHLTTPIFVLALALLAGAPLIAESTCVCTASYIGIYGGRPLNQVNSAWSTCASGCAGSVDTARLMETQNTQRLRAGMQRSWSLPEQEYVLWARNMEQQQKQWEAELRAASRPRHPSDPLQAAMAELTGDGRTMAGSYRLRIEKGDLILRGEVPTIWMRDQALVAASASSGMSVRSELRVTSLGTVTDEQLRYEVGRALGHAPTGVTVTNGMVEVPDKLSPEQVESLYQVPGVRGLR